MNKSSRDAVALIRLGSLGDVLIATPALRETIQKFSGKPVYVVGSSLWLKILSPRMWPEVSGVLTMTKKGREARLYRPEGDLWRAAEEKITIMQLLHRCAVTVNLRIDSFRFLSLAWFARVPRRHGTCPWYLKFLVTHWSPWLNQTAAIHERDRLLRIVDAPRRRLFPLGLESQNRRNLFLNPEAPAGDGGRGAAADYATPLQAAWPKTTLPYIWLRRGLPQLAKADTRVLRDKFHLEAKSYWLVNPTSSLVEKAWPADRFRIFCAQYAATLKKRKKSLVITGAPHETDWLKSVATGDFRVIQPHTFTDLLQLVAGAEVLITNTSSLQFIAAATLTPAITLVGRATPARWGPVGPNDISVWGQLPKNFRGNFREQEIASYEEISVDQLRAAAQKMTERLNQL